MAIHPQSVISKNIKDFNIDFYKSLTEKENYCYTSNRLYAEFDNYEPFFTALNSAIMSYLNANRSITTWYSLTNSIYVYDYLREKIQGVVSEDDLLATYITNIDDYIPFLLQQPIDYFDDIIRQSEFDPETGQTTFYFECPTLESDAARITAEATSLTTENSKIEAVESAIRTGVNQAIQRAVYSNIERDFSGQSKDAKYKYIFEDLKYKEISQKLNGLQNLDPRS